jgi:hypothetical protein
MIEEKYVILTTRNATDDAENLENISFQDVAPSVIKTIRVSPILSKKYNTEKKQVIDNSSSVTQGHTMKEFASGRFVGGLPSPSVVEKQQQRTKSISPSENVLSSGIKRSLSQVTSESDTQNV